MEKTSKFGTGLIFDIQFLLLTNNNNSNQQEKHNIFGLGQFLAYPMVPSNSATPMVAIDVSRDLALTWHCTAAVSHKPRQQKTGATPTLGPGNERKRILARCRMPSDLFFKFFHFEVQSSVPALGAWSNFSWSSTFLASSSEPWVWRCRRGNLQRRLACWQRRKLLHPLQEMSPTNVCHDILSVFHHCTGNLSFGGRHPFIGVIVVCEAVILEGYFHLWASSANCEMITEIDAG